MPNPTSEFDRLMKLGFSRLYPQGSSHGAYRSPNRPGAYVRTVRPDYVVPGMEWIDFKLYVSFKEKKDVPWRPSALYTSLRKYLDHPDNPSKTLKIIYGFLYGELENVRFPIFRGKTMLIRDSFEFQQRIHFQSAEAALAPLSKSPDYWILKEVRALLKQQKSNSYGPRFSA